LHPALVVATKARPHASVTALPTLLPPCGKQRRHVVAAAAAAAPLPSSVPGRFASSPYRTLSTAIERRNMGSIRSVDCHRSLYRTPSFDDCSIHARPWPSMTGDGRDQGGTAVSTCSRHVIGRVRGSRARRWCKALRHTNTNPLSPTSWCRWGRCGQLGTVPRGLWGPLLFFFSRR